MSESPATLDADTLAFYAREAADYAERTTRMKPWGHIEAFMKMLPEGGRILELGCGGGRDAAAMIAAGFDVTPTDGCPEMAKAAEAYLERPVRVLEFSDLDEVEEYDGVWASAALLHVPRAGLPEIYARVHRALKPGGVFYSTYKAGTEGGRDMFGRYYNYLSEDDLRGMINESTGWRDVLVLKGMGPSLEGEPVEWLHCFATKAENA